jgi:hypothetical protein
MNHKKETTKINYKKETTKKKPQKKYIFVFIVKYILSYKYANRRKSPLQNI